MPAVETAYPINWFVNDMKLRIRSNEKRKHWFGVTRTSNSTLSPNYLRKEYMRCYIRVLWRV